MGHTHTHTRFPEVEDQKKEALLIRLSTECSGLRGKYERERSIQRSGNDPQNKQSGDGSVLIKHKIIKVKN